MNSEVELELQAYVDGELAGAEARQIEQLLATDGARLSVLRMDPVMRDARQLATAREKAHECETLADEAQKRETKAHTQLVQEATAAQRRRDNANTTRSELNIAASSADTFADDTGLGKDHSDIFHGMDLPDGIVGLSAEAPAALARKGREAESRRREQIAVVRRRLRAVDSAIHARDAAHAMGAPLGVISFEPHARMHFNPEAPPFRLMNAHQLARTVETLAADRLYLLPFGVEMANFSDHDFVSDVLVKGLGVRHVAVGFDITFGKGRTGNPEAMRRYHGLATSCHADSGNGAAEIGSPGSETSVAVPLTTTLHAIPWSRRLAYSKRSL